jgi:hypothetical protein
MKSERGDFLWKKYGGWFSLHGLPAVALRDLYDGD